MGVQEHGAADVPRQLRQHRAKECSDLLAVVFIAAEGVGRLVDHDQLRAEVSRGLDDLIEARRGVPASVRFEADQHVVGADGAGPTHVAEVGPIDAKRGVDTVLATMDFVAIVLAEQAEHAAAPDGEAAPVGAGRAGGHQLLGEQRFARAAVTVVERPVAEREPILDDDSEQPVRQRPLKPQRLLARRRHPQPRLALGRRGQDDRHCLRVDRRHDRVRRAREEGEQRPILAQGKPVRHGRLAGRVLAKRVRRNEAARWGAAPKPWQTREPAHRDPKVTTASAG